MVTIDSSTTIITGVVNEPLNYLGLQNSGASHYAVVPCPMGGFASDMTQPASGLGITEISYCPGLPFGLSINSSNGILTGEARVTGSYYADLYTIKNNGSDANGSLIKKISKISFTKGLSDYTVAVELDDRSRQEGLASGQIEIFLRDDGKFNVSANIGSCLDFDLSLSDRSSAALFQYLQPFIVRGCLDADDAEIIIGLLQENDVEDFIVFQGDYGFKSWVRAYFTWLFSSDVEENTIVYSGSPGVICLKKSGEVKSIGFKGSSPVINAVKNIPSNARSGVKKIEAAGWTILAIKTDGTIVPWGGYSYSSTVHTGGAAEIPVCLDPRPPNCGIWTAGNPCGWPWGCNCSQDGCPCRCPQNRFEWRNFSERSSSSAQYLWDKSGVIRGIPSNLPSVRSVYLTQDYAISATVNGGLRAWGDMALLSLYTNWSNFSLYAATGPNFLRSYTKVANMRGFVALTTDGKIVTLNPVLQNWAAALEKQNIKVLDINDSGVINLDNGYSIVWLDPDLPYRLESMYGPGAVAGRGNFRDHTDPDLPYHSCFANSMLAIKQRFDFTRALTSGSDLSLPLLNENGAVLLPFKVRELGMLNGASYLISEAQGDFPNYYFCGTDPKWIVKKPILVKIHKGFADIDTGKPFVERPDNNIVVHAAEKFTFTLTRRADELDIYNDLALVDSPAWSLVGAPDWMTYDSYRNRITGTPPTSLVGSSVSFTLMGRGYRNGQVAWSRQHQLTLNVITAKPLFNAQEPVNKYNFTIGWGDPISATITILNPEDTLSVKPATVLPPGFSFSYDTETGIGNFTGNTKINLGTTTIRLKAEGTSGSSTAIVEFKITYGDPIVESGSVVVKNRRPVIIDLKKFVTNLGSNVAVKDWSCTDDDLLSSGLSIKRKEGIIVGVLSTLKDTVELEVKATSYTGDISTFTITLTVESAPVMWGLPGPLQLNATVGEYFEHSISFPSSSDPSSPFLLDLPTGLIIDFANQKIKGTPEAEGTFVCPVLSSYRALDVAVSTSGLSAIVLYDNTVVTWNVYTGEYVATPTEAESVVSVAAGGKGIIALRKDGTVISWGYSGLLEIPADARSGVIGISAYGSTFASLKDDGRIAVWSFGNSRQSSIISAPTVGERKSMSVAKDYIIALNDQGVEAFPLKGGLCIDPNLSDQKPFILKTDESSYFSSIVVGSESWIGLRKNGKVDSFILPTPRYQCYDDCCYNTSYRGNSEVFDQVFAASVAAVDKTLFVATEQNKLVVTGNPSLYPKDLTMPIRFLKIVGAGAVGIILGENGSLTGIGSAVIPAFLFSEYSQSIVFDVAPQPPDNRRMNNGKWMSANNSGDKVAMLGDVSLKNDPSRSKKVNLLSFDKRGMKWNNDGFVTNDDSNLISNSSVCISENGKRIIIGGNKNI
jgi:hypothetical protein